MYTLGSQRNAARSTSLPSVRPSNTPRTAIEFPRAEPPGKTHKRYGYTNQSQQFSIFAPTEDSPFHITEITRFEKSRDSALVREREYRKQHYEDVIECKRRQNAQREEQRWVNLQESKEQESKKWASRTSRTNGGSVPFNFLTLEYHQTHEGKALKYYDDLKIYRKDVRAKNMYEKYNSCNPITGEDALRMKTPVPPTLEDVPSEQ